MILIYCELTENEQIADVSLELCTKGRSLADRLGTELEALVCGSRLEGVGSLLHRYGVDTVLKAEDARLYPYRTLPHFALLSEVIRERQPEIVLMGATCVGRDLAPRIASRLRCGLTADCTSLEIGDYEDKSKGKTYKNILYQIRPAFGGNIIATIVNPETRPQMATVREGVMKMEPAEKPSVAEVKELSSKGVLDATAEVVKIIDRHIEAQKVNLKAAQIIVSGGYGVGSRENFDQLYQLAAVFGGEVAATRAAVDAG
ncbi:MAG: electron transfer flavoprotein subunit alpha/FixB family protein, partial [Bacteroidales bacterium]|nr:electron transfer flavoprotein subunit alpha/FixB family protein [Bacteroidales bacterium]